MIDLGVFDIKNQSLSINKLKEILKYLGVWTQFLFSSRTSVSSDPEQSRKISFARDFMRV